ncbi:DUF4038 domain-containing protein [Brucella sp. 10RB9214]|uniref:apiosidase-like domain-containing protein n=1 Tax=unclassified Brucella TaxID=2632610 RepID=UPI0009728050|nr:MULTISPECIES: DUF4038 domain-containing protein [unclassified Brucella]APY15945.1 hypothetical protein BKD02_17110 [Brucella sp. 09RB8910]MRN47226.1 DUF4038 domain-containing protein [Brucella sp. 10RB9212]MRN50076.1 DUF4038 domain-containing protein [Brucella sp. 10RB9214]
MPTAKIVRGIALFLLAFAMTGGARATAADTQFPLQVSGDRHRLQDAAATPCLLMGDAAWSLIAELRRDEAEAYLQDRRRRGFNAVLVNLLEHQFARNAPANAYGDRPFKARAFGALNPQYFDHAAWVIGRAEALGITVFLAPAYLGANGGGQGWYMAMEMAGPKRMRAYGEAIARRFAGYRNIIWVLGGDFDAPDKQLVSSLAEGIATVLPDAIQTVHSSRDTDTARHWAGAGWLALDTVYDYDDVHKAVLARTAGAEMPVILLETLYENEHGTDAGTIRRNAYGALLAGAAGQFFGNSPIWHFSAPGLFDSGGNWRKALDSPGARSMSVLQNLFSRLDWTKLQPDREKKITDRLGFYAARLPETGLAVIYGENGFALRKGAVEAGDAALWFDPASGKTIVAGAPARENGLLVYHPPASRNADGHSDWVLLIGRMERLAFLQKE